MICGFSEPVHKGATFCFVYSQSMERHDFCNWGCYIQGTYGMFAMKFVYRIRLRGVSNITRLAPLRQ